MGWPLYLPQLLALSTTGLVPCRIFIGGSYLLALIIWTSWTSKLIKFIKKLVRLFGDLKKVIWWFGLICCVITTPLSMGRMRAETGRSFLTELSALDQAHGFQVTSVSCQITRAHIIHSVPQFESSHTVLGKPLEGSRGAQLTPPRQSWGKPVLPCCL